MKVYLKQPFQAEQFDGSEEMAKKYNITPPMPLDPDYTINTLEGDMVLGVGDWIATGVNGEHWPIADGIFKKTYSELPTIPKYVADYITVMKSEGKDLVEALGRFLEHWRMEDDIDDYIGGNSETLARAWLDGYVVGEENNNA